MDKNEDLETLVDPVSAPCSVHVDPESNDVGSSYAPREEYKISQKDYETVELRIKAYECLD